MKKVKEYIYTDPKFTMLVIDYFDNTSKKKCSKAAIMAGRYPSHVLYRDAKPFVPENLELVDQSYFLRYFNFIEILDKYLSHRIPYNILLTIATEIKNNIEYKEFFYSTIEDALNTYSENSHTQKNIKSFADTIELYIERAPLYYTN